jgi:uncharacterized protein YkwD
MQKSRFTLPATILLAALLMSAACAGLFSPSSGKTPVELEQEIFKIVNYHRRGIGAIELVWNDTIAEQARIHSQDMADGTVPFGHDGYETRFAIIGQSIPWKAGAEIVALAPTPSSALNGWLGSPDHKPYVEGDYYYTGVGVVWDKSGSSFYATQIFIKPR